MIRVPIAIFVLVSSLMLFACKQTPEVYTADINPLSWTQDESVSVSFVNEDTVSLRNISIITRYIKNNNASDLMFVLSTVTPTGIVWSDTITMSRDLGEHISSDMWENEMIYRKNVIFGERGLYRVHFKPLENTNGVYAMGIHVIGL